jgi:hypothetical protein
MITSLKNEQGYIYSLIEWEQIDKDHILIKYSWIHESYRGNGCIKRMVKIMAKDESTHDTDFVGWERGSENKKFKWYPLHRILRRIYG